MSKGKPVIIARTPMGPPNSYLMILVIIVLQFLDTNLPVVLVELLVHFLALICYFYHI